MKRILLLSVAVATTISSFAQTKIKNQKVFGGNGDDAFKHICVASNGDLLFGGTSNSNKSGNKSANSKGGDDVWIVRTNKTGDKKWDETIGGSQTENFEDMKLTADSGFIIVAASSSNKSGDKTEDSRGMLDYWIIKLSKSGKIEWDKTFGGSANDVPLSVEQTSDSGYIVAGWSQSPASGDKTDNSKGGTDIWLVKISATGTMQWNKTIGGSGDDGNISNGTVYSDDNIHGVVCKQAKNGDYVIGASSGSNSSGDKSEDSRGGSDYWLIRTDKKGTVLWDKTIGGSSNDYLNALELTSDGGCILGGYSVSDISGEKTTGKKGGFDYWLLKLSKIGTIQLEKTIGGGGYDVLTSMQQTSDGGLVVGGFSRSGKSGDKTSRSNGDTDYWIVKLNSLGTIKWNKTIGGDSTETYVDVKETEPNVYWIGGWSFSDVSGDKTLPKKGNSDYWVVRLIDSSSITTDLITANTINSNKDIVQAKKFLAYPNPAINIVHVQVTGKTTLVLTDQSGKRMLVKTVDGNADLNIEHLSSGTYYLTNITTGAVQRIVIVK